MIIHIMIRNQNHKVIKIAPLILSTFVMSALIPANAGAEIPKPKIVWILSQPALKPQSTKINQSLKYSIGFKPNFDRTKFLTKRFTHRNFISRSRHR